MMRQLCVFISLLSLDITAFAGPNQVYSPSSQLAVQKVNKAFEVLRDPTAMSSNFREALRQLPNNKAVSVETEKGVASSQELGFPDIELVGKVLSQTKAHSVVFKINGKYFHFEEGEQVSLVVDNQVVTLHVQVISQHTVRLLMMPFNKTLLFN